MTQNILIIHGGGPTAVMNGSLYGLIEATRKYQFTGKVFAARNGTEGLLKEDFIDLTDFPLDQLSLLKQTPGTAIGTSRTPLEKEDYEQMVHILNKYDIGYVFFNGGNGTMDTCGRLFQTIQEHSFDIKVMGIPKTMDNDLAITDHSPGFGSAARYMAQSVKEICADVKGLPIHVVVIEALGRNAGWITAASQLADPSGEFAPDLLYLPEVPFDEDKFLSDIADLLKVKSGIVVVASEGLVDKEGKLIVKPIFQVGRATYFGDVSAHLANLVIQKLGYKARGEKPGLLGRASIALQSSVDLEEAVLAGAKAFEAAMAGSSGQMVAFKRIENSDYQIETFLVDIEEVMLYERTMPKEFINENGNGVTQAFIDWCQPLIGPDLPDMISFN